MRKSFLIIAILITSSFYAQAQFSGGTADGFAMGEANAPFALATVPTITTTTAISSISTTTASSGGQTLTDGGAAITAKGVVWSTAPAPTIDTKTGITDDGTGTNDFTSAITGLQPNTTYYVRAYATNDAGTGYGTEVNFTTTLAEGVNISDEDIDYDGRKDIVFINPQPTPDAVRTVTEMGYQIATNLGMTANMQYINDPNAIANGDIMINWDDYNYGTHYYARWYIKYSTGAPDYGQVWAFEKNEGSGVIKIGSN